MTENISLLLTSEEDFMQIMNTTVKCWREEYRIEGYFAGYDGASIYYSYYLNPAEKGAVVISHGFCEFEAKYHELMYVLFQLGYSVFFLEHRGHGRSARFVKDYSKVYVKSFDEYVCDLDIFVRRIVMKESISKKYYLFSHSMGGAVATLYIEKYPDIFEKAVLSSPLHKLNQRGEPDWKIRIMLGFARTLGLKRHYSFKQHAFDRENVFERSSCLSKARYEYGFEFRMNYKEYTTYGAAFAWVIAARKACKKLIGNSERIKIPVLLLEASKDTMVDNEGHTEFLKKVPQGQRVIFEHSKHEIFNSDYEDRVRYYKVIDDFLRG